MKVRLQDIVKHCQETYPCYICEYNEKGDCTVKIDGYCPYMYTEYYLLCGSCPELAKALYTNEEIEL